jgi:hypothetical protein
MTKPLSWKRLDSSYRLRRCGVNGVKVAEPNGEKRLATGTSE